MPGSLGSWLSAGLNLLRAAGRKQECDRLLQEHKGVCTADTPASLQAPQLPLAARRSVRQAEETDREPADTDRHECVPAEVCAQGGFGIRFKALVFGTEQAKQIRAAAASQTERCLLFRTLTPLSHGRHPQVLRRHLQAGRRPVSTETHVGEQL